MKILFLGTGAADWRGDAQKLPSRRRFSSALVDGVLLIDPNPHVLPALEEYGIKASDIKYILNTHRHSDHFCANTLNTLTALGARFFDISAGENASFEKYSVTAFTANHSTAKDAKHFIISDGEKRLFYGLDGAWLLYDEVAAIKEKGVDLAVLDATVGEKEGDYRIFEHNDLSMIISMKKALEDHVRHFCISHMARTLHESHEALKEKMSGYGIDVAHDGYKIEF